MNEAAFRASERRVWDAVGVAPPREQVVAGVRVQELGAADAPPVVLVHGTTISGVSWADLVAALADRRRCLVLDRPGCGLSAPAAHDFPALIPAVLDGIGVDTADVIATSYGAHFALHTAIDHPARISRLVLLGWSVGAPMRPMPLLMRVGNNKRLGLLMARMPVNRRMVTSMLKQISVRNPPAHVIEGFLSMLRHTDTTRNEVVAGVWPADVVFSAGDLARVTTPTHLLWGTDDVFGGAAEASAFASMIPGATLTLLDGAGHAPWLDDPGRVVAEIESFLR